MVERLSRRQHVFPSARGASRYHERPPRLFFLRVHEFNYLSCQAPPDVNLIEKNTGMIQIFPRWFSTLLLPSSVPNPLPLRTQRCSLAQLLLTLHHRQKVTLPSQADSGSASSKAVPTTCPPAPPGPQPQSPLPARQAEERATILSTPCCYSGRRPTASLSWRPLHGRPKAWPKRLAQ